MVREALTAAHLDALEPRDAAAQFIARRAEGLTTSEEQLLADWLARNDSHRRVFESADRAWQTFGDAEGDEILAAMRAHALAPQTRSWTRWRPAAAAAAVLIVAVGAATFFFQRGESIVAPIQYASGRGEVKELQLPDGSRMTLDADSAAVGRFSDDGRAIELTRGRALFAVVREEARAFAVTAAGRRVVAVGTRFDVDLAADTLSVTLLEGRVRIESLDSAGAPTVLEAGQQYVERLGQATVRNVETAGDNATAWLAGLIKFDNQPLGEAAAVMNRYSRDQIVISDPDVASIKLSGQFRAGETQRFAETVAEAYQLKSKKRENEIELSPR